jgi:hypothetical protein
MQDELQKRLDALGGEASRLYVARNQANEIVATVEEQLLEMGVGVTVESEHAVLFQRTSTCSHGVSNVFEVCVHLAFGKLHGRYQIHVMEHLPPANNASDERNEEHDNDLIDDDDDESTQERLVTWSSCTCEMRLELVKTLPDLLHAIAREIERLSATAETTIAKIKALAGRE